MSERTEAIYNSIRNNYGRMANGVRPWENNRDEFNDVLNYAPTENQQTFDLGTDDAGNTILGNAFNNLSLPEQQQQDTSVLGNVMDYLGSGSNTLVDDYDGEDVNRDDDMDTLIAGPTTGLDRAGQKAEDLWRAAQNTSLYASYMYSAADWADKGKWIFDKTGIDVNSLGNKEVFEKAWKLANEVERQEKLATDANGHVNMDKVYEAMPYLQDIHDAYGTAAAVQVMNAAPGLRTINDVYDSELARFGGSLSVGAQRGYYQFMTQVTGAKAMLRALANNKNLSPEEMQEVIRLNDALEALPDFSYSSPGAALGGLLGSAAEQAPIMLPEMIRTGAAITGKFPFAASKAVSAALYAAMSTQIAGSQFINNATRTDSEGRPIYTPREAALLSLAQGLAEGYLEKQSIAAAGRAVFSRETAKKLADLYAKDAALAADTAGVAMSATAREILRERIQHGFKAGILSGAAELEEEFEQQVSDMVLENIAQIATRGSKADVASIENILSESFGAAVEAIPAVAGFAVIGAGGSVVADSRRILNMRKRFEDAEASRLQRAVFENQEQKNIVFGVAQNLNNISDLEGKSPEVVTTILDSQNSKFDVEDSEVDIGILMQEGHADIVDAIAKEAGKTQEEIQANLSDGQYLTVKTSALQKAISKMTPDQQQALDPHITANGRMTDYRVREYAKSVREALQSLQEKTDTEQQDIVDRFVQESFPDNDEVQTMARDLIMEDIENPRAAVNRRIRAVQKSIDEFLSAEKEAEPQESGEEGTAPSDREESPTQNDELNALSAERQNLQLISDALSGIEKGDFLVTASMMPEEREVFNTVNSILSQHTNEDVRNSARMSAVLAARQLSRLAEAWREAGREVTAADLLPTINVDGRNIVRDQSALSQAIVNQQMEEVRRQYEGTDQWMKAPNGQTSKLTEEQWLIVRTPAFKNWFGDWENDPEHASKIVDENGEPLVVYHWTNNVFDTFRSGNMAKTIYFSESKKGARKAARGKRNVLECFLNVKNPVNEKTDPVHWYDAEESLNVYKWKKDGRDGVFVRDEAGTSIAVFEPTQIKSATDNNGQFSVDDPDIYHQVKEDSQTEGSLADQKLNEDIENWKKEVEDIASFPDQTDAERLKMPVVCSRLPLVYSLVNKAVGIDDVDINRPIVITKKHFYEILHVKETKKNHGHKGEMAQEIVGKLPELLANPVGIMKNYDKNGNVIPGEVIAILEAKDKAGNVIIAPVSLKEESGAYRLKTFFGKNAEEKFGKRFFNIDNILYASNKKRFSDALEQLAKKRALGVKLTYGDTLFSNIPSEKDLVKLRNQNIGYYQEVNGTNLGSFSSMQRLISLFENADESTFMHEMSHFYLSELEKIANIAPNSQAARDLATVRAWAEWKPGDAEAFKDSKTAAEFAEREKQILAAEAAGNDAEVNRLKRVWMQEKFARGFETYLASGKAPTSALERLFSRFKKWLKQIYGDVTGAGVLPSAEVAAVMDRMIASDEEIETMAIIRDASMITNADPKLLDGKTSAMMDRWKEEANEKAKSKLLKQLLDEYREKDIAAHMEEFREMEAERLQALPAFRVQMLIQEAKIPEADAVATEGYASVEAWKEDLAQNGGSYENALDASVAAELDRYTREMPNDEHIMELAEEAMHSSDAEGKIAALEAEILARWKRSYEKSPAEIWLRGVRDAALGMYKLNREMAQRDLESMPAKDATNFRLWANKAKQSAQQALKSLANAVRKQNSKKKEDNGEKDYEAARQAKIRQSVLDARAQEAIKLKRELTRIVDHLKRRSKTISKDKRGEIDASTRYYINHILYMLGINKSDAPKPKTLVPFNLLFANLKDKFDTENAANGSIGDLDMDFEVPQWLADIATAEKTPPEKYNEYTMPEIRDIRTLVDILYTTSRNKNRLLTTDKSLLDVLSDLIEDWQKTVTVEDGDTGISKPMALVLQPQVMLKTMGSTFKKYIYDTLADAWEQQTARQQEAAGYLNTLFEKYWPSKRERRKMRKDVLAVRAPDGTELTKENVLMIALNWGNEGNRLRVVNGFTHDGFVCTEGDVDGVLRQVMTKKDWEFVQEVWDYLNRLGDNVNEVVEKSTGAPMKRVEALSFAIYSDTDDVSIQLRGGYYPIVYDPEKSVGRSEQELMTAAQSMGGASTFGTGLGSTKARSAEGLQESPLLLSMDTLFKHVNQQIHISTMRLACRDAYKILTNSNVQGMMTKTLGIPAYRELKRWIENVWQEPISDGNWFTQKFESLRGKTVGAIMAYRTSVSLLNFANPVYMAREMGLFNAFCALSDFYLHPSLYAEKRRWVKENSPFMANRAHNIDRDLNQSKQNSFDPGNPISSMIFEYANWLIEETDMMCSMPTYWWTYQQTLNAELEKGTAQDEAEKTAHRAAEDIVRKIFGSSDTVDQSSVQRTKNIFMKAITPFYTFTSTQANALWEQIYKARYQGSDRSVKENGEIQARKKAFYRRYWGAANSALWTYFVGTLIEQMMRDFIDYLTGGDDKDKMDPTSEAFLRRWASQSMTTFTSAVPVLNMAGEAVSTYILGQRYSSRNFGVIDASLNRYSSAFTDAAKYLQGKKDAIDAGRSVAKAIAGSGFGMPDTFTDAIFNAARAYVDHYSFDEWFWKSLFDRKLKKKGR